MDFNSKDSKSLIWNIYKNLGAYNGDPVHDGRVNFDYHENTGELSDIFDDTDLDEFVDNLNDWD